MTTAIAPDALPVPVAGATGTPAVTGVLASLPRSLVPAASGEVQAVDGTAGWATITADAIRAGARVVVVTEPQPDDEAAIERLTGLATARQATVLLGEGWAGNPAVSAVASEWGKDLATADLIEAELHVKADPSEAHLLALLRTLRALGRPVPYPGTTVTGVGSTAVVVREGRDTWALLVTRTAGSEHAHLSLAGDLVQIELDLPAPLTSRPALARRIDTRSEERLDTRYETGHRVAWRRARLAVDTPTDSDDLAGFAADLRAARSILTTHTRKEPS